MSVAFEKRVRVRHTECVFFLDPVHSGRRATAARAHYARVQNYLLSIFIFRAVKHVSIYCIYLLFAQSGVRLSANIDKS